MTIKGASRVSGLSWDVVKEIEKLHLKRKYKAVSLKGLRLIGVDEIAIKKGRRYATIVIDLKSGRIVWVERGRNSESLGAFLIRLKRSRAKLEAISMDMCAAYSSSVVKHFPRVPIVYDHFHVIQQMNKKLDELRMQYVREVENKHRESVKGVRWLILMNSEKVEEQSKSRPTWKMLLNRALRLNKPLAKGYYLKEKLRLLWTLPNKEEGESFLKRWCKEAKSSGLVPLQEMVSLLEKHREGILSYFSHRISNGPVEGIIHKIKNLKRMAYGYRDWDFFTLKLYSLHESKLELIG